MILLLSIGGAASAQLLPLLDQYHMNGLAINPAYAGSQDALNIEMHSRKQWVGFEGSPRTLTFSMHGPMREKKVNLGIIVMSDKYGSNLETGFLFNYAYRIEMRNGKLSLGMAAGVTSFLSDMDAIRFIDTGDLLLQYPAKRVFMPEFSLGSYFHSDRFYIGLSMPLFLSHPVNESNGRYSLGFNLAAANYILVGGYLFRISEDFELLPSMLLRTNPANNTQLDLNCTGIFRERIWLGTTIRTNGNLSVILQLRVNQQFRVGYSYGYEISELSNYQQGSHEVILVYSFKYMLEVVSPRYF
ncbi:MAG: type IX secretion system membrane protein PorP/SprF [Bacteroidales bacterium]|nr:type IX secretion system membrane protein PorP/SprF [Bacteroidales bacterium]